MLPYIRKSRVSLKPLWGIDSRLKQFGGMAAAIVVYVGISQFGYFVTSRIAASADALAPNIYQQAWLLLQVPYGIIGVTLLTAIMPRLSRNAADGDDKAVVEDLVMGSKMTYIALIPIVIFFTIFGTDIAKGLFAYGKFDVEAATVLGWTLSFSAFTLLPYSTVLLHLRVFYAREEAWTPHLHHRRHHRDQSRPVVAGNHGGHRTAETRYPPGCGQWLRLRGRRPHRRIPATTATRGPRHQASDSNMRLGAHVLPRGRQHGLSACTTCSNSQCGP